MDLGFGTAPGAVPLTRRPRLALGLLAALATAGCHGEKPVNFKSIAEPPSVHLIQPPLRTIVRTVGQPSFIEAYERTSIYPKLTAYIKKWIVDIGDKVKKDEVLATLFVPELVEDYETKKATVELDTKRVTLAQKMVDVADADVKAAAAHLAESKAILAKFQAEVDRWDSEVKRLTVEVKRNVVSPQILLESTNQLKSNTAAREAASATISTADAELLSKQATADKARIDVEVARANLAVAVSDRERIKAWVGYLTLTAPFDGIIVARNANTFDFVLPATGDPTAMRRSPDVSTGGAAPIYVVDRTDVIRVFVDVPEKDANYVQIGTKASVLARAYRDDEIPASVTRTSWALNVTSRTLRAEIDMPNPGAQILPGMYAYAKVIIERPDVRTVPVAAVTYVGDKAFCWLYDKDRARQTEVRTGISDGQWIEVPKRRLPPSEATPDGEEAWVPVDGSEHVILGDLSILVDGAPVKVIKQTGGTGAG